MGYGLAFLSLFNTSNDTLHTDFSYLRELLPLESSNIMYSREETLVDKINKHCMANGLYNDKKYEAGFRVNLPTDQDILKTLDFYRQYADDGFDFFINSPTEILASYTSDKSGTSLDLLLDYGSGAYFAADTGKGKVELKVLSAFVCGDGKEVTKVILNSSKQDPEVEKIIIDKYIVPTYEMVLDLLPEQLDDPFNRETDHPSPGPSSNTPLPSPR